MDLGAMYFLNVVLLSVVGLFLIRARAYNKETKALEIKVKKYFELQQKFLRKSNYAQFPQRSADSYRNRLRATERARLRQVPKE